MATANNTRTQSVIALHSDAREVGEYDAMTRCMANISTLVGRYHYKLRPDLHRGLGMTGGNGWQLLESFPWLAARIFLIDDDPAKAARDLAGRGARIRDVAQAAGVPMCFRRFGPKATRRLLDTYELLSQHPKLVSHHCPAELRRQVSWLRVIATARENGHDEFAIWTAVHWESLSDEDRLPHRIMDSVGNIGDWIRADSQARAQSSISKTDIEKISMAMVSTGDSKAAAKIQDWWHDLGEPVTASRSFNVNMSPRTVLRLSDEWHERAAVAKAADVPFPDPWVTGDTIDGYQIAPITNSADLAKFAYNLHNCATTYAQRIAKNDVYLYIVLEGDAPVAMLDLRRENDGRIRLFTTQGHCNHRPADEIIHAVRKWWHGKCQNG